MRPKFLEIEGLQSFKELQKIDFDKLRETGLFGIFGPTGSGKSTILDAITLALYGNVLRAKNGTYGIINTEKSNVRVSFTFDLVKNNDVKTYRVERAYKRKKNAESNTESNLARLMELNDDEVKTIADKAREVDAKVIELLGLTIDDFTRSVVLPQNKFQEFLLLEKAKKREMLERIFYLEEYGKQLSEKFKRKMSALEHKLASLDGVRSMLGDMSQEKLTQAEAELQTAVEERQKADKELQLAEKEYNEVKEIWQFANELKGVLQAENEHLAKLEEIKSKKLILENAQKAESLMEGINKYYEVKANLAEAESALDDVNARLPELKEAMLKATAEHQQANELAEKEIPVLIARKGKLNEALEINKELLLLEEKLFSMQKSLAELEKGKHAQERELTAGKERLAKSEDQLVVLGQKLETLKVDPVYRREIQGGTRLEDNLKKLEKEKNIFQQKQQEIYSKLDASEKELAGVLMKKESILGMLETLKSELIAQEQVKPADRKELSLQETAHQEIKDTFLELQRKKEFGNQLSDKLHVIEQNVVQLNDEYKKVLAEKQVMEGKFAAKQEELDALEKRQTQSIAFSLAKSLKDDQACPVCGSVHHPNPAVSEDIAANHDLDKQVQQFKEELVLLENEKRQIESSEIKLSENLKHHNEQAKQLGAEVEANNSEYAALMDRLPKHLKGLGLEEIEEYIDALKESQLEKQAALEAWEAGLQEIKEKIAAGNEELAQCNVRESGKAAAIEGIKENLKAAEKQLSDVGADFAAIEQEYTSFLAQFGIKSASFEAENIANKDLEYERLQQDLDGMRDGAKKLQKELDEENKAMQFLEKQLASVGAEVRGYLVQKEDRQKKVLQLTEGKDANKGLQEIEYRLQALHAAKQAAEQRLKKLQDDQNVLINKKSTVESRREIYHKSLQDESLRLQEMLKEKGFASIEAVKQAALELEEKKSIEAQIINYEAMMHKLETQKALLQGKLKGRSIDEGQWHDATAAYQQKIQHKEECIAAYEKAKHNFETVNANYGRWVLVDKEWQVYSRKKEVVAQIQKLLKGNSFVEYICEERLSYVAKEASETLGVLTKYRYALELDTESGFVIRDNANGGVLRTVSTLSGGETFLTSLSLALALSSQIQLKGQSPLEFFFLDEGFGTLDANLLDTVIDSLERLHSSNRVIGLISHVPELKNRIARRLIVEPPTPNGKGSRVRIEKA